MNCTSINGEGGRGQEKRNRLVELREKERRHFELSETQWVEAAIWLELVVTSPRGSSTIRLVVTSTTLMRMNRQAQMARTLGVDQAGVAEVVKTSEKI
jgi:hypothetical protein